MLCEPGDRVADLLRLTDQPIDEARSSPEAKLGVVDDHAERQFVRLGSGRDQFHDRSVVVEGVRTESSTCEVDDGAGVADDD
nr:hypothetical protein [Micromonospora sp. DSM 115978]